MLTYLKTLAGLFLMAGISLVMGIVMIAGIPILLLYAPLRQTATEYIEDQISADNLRKLRE
jgi:hypothetical protein